MNIVQQKPSHVIVEARRPTAEPGRIIPRHFFVGYGVPEYEDKLVFAILSTKSSAVNPEAFEVRDLVEVDCDTARCIAERLIGYADALALRLAVKSEESCPKT